MPVAFRREVLDHQRTVVREIRMLGRSRQSGAAALGLGRHAHPTAWELCWFARGSADWWVGGEIHELDAGWCYLTRPGEEHGSLSGMLEACDLHWVQLDTLDGILPGLEDDHAASVAEAMRAAPHAFPAPDLGPHWDALWEAMRAQGPLTAATVRSAMHRLLLAALAAAVRRPTRPSPPIARAIARAGEGRASVVALARAAGMSRSSFHQRFLAEVGDSPAAWLRRRRMREAKRLLWRGDRSVTDIAHACGFATSQRFATAMREATGLSPQAWREHVRSFG